MSRATLRPTASRGGPSHTGAAGSESFATQSAKAWTRNGLAIRRFPTEDATSDETAPDEEAAPGAETEAAPVQAIAAFLAPDDAPDLADGQMRRSEFLSALFDAVCGTARAALAGTIWNEPCPTIEGWFAYYSDKSAEHIESALRRYAPEAAGAESAGEYLPIVAARIRSGIAAYLSTGSIEGLPAQLPAGGIDTLGAPANVSLLAGEGGGDTAVSPVRVQAQLGRGEPMDSGVRGRMESAFGADLSDVRVHDDTPAASLADRLDARAFTVGPHVAFGAGEYQPGSLIGDALMAHELAHVMQQRGATAEGADTAALEENADRSAESAVASTWAGTRISMAHLRSGLSLQRCSHDYTNDEIVANREKIQALIGNPDIEADTIVGLIDGLGDNAYQVLMKTLPFAPSTGKTQLEYLAGTEGGRKILQRAADALAKGDLLARSRSDDILKILKDHSAAAPAVKVDDQTQIDRINKAIDADPNKGEYGKVKPPLKLPVQLYRFDVEEFGQVYYDPGMPKVAPGIAGSTDARGWKFGSAQKQYPLIYIRMGPLALSYTDEYLRHVLWHEFQHYKRNLEYRKDDASKSEDTKTLEGETGVDKPNNEAEATSIGLADYYGKLSDDEVKNILRYLSDSLSSANDKFRDAAVDRIRKMFGGDTKKEAAFLKLVLSLSKTQVKNLDALVKAIQADLKAPAPKKKTK